MAASEWTVKMAIFLFLCLVSVSEGAPAAGQIQFSGFAGFVQLQPDANEPFVFKYRPYQLKPPPVPQLKSEVRSNAEANEVITTERPIDRFVREYVSRLEQAYNLQHRS